MRELDILLSSLYTVLSFQPDLVLASAGDQINKDPIDQPRGGALQF